MRTRQLAISSNAIGLPQVHIQDGSSRDDLFASAANLKHNRGEQMQYYDRKKAN
jgi:hypothetical protein